MDNIFFLFKSHCIYNKLKEEKTEFFSLIIKKYLVQGHYIIFSE